VTCAIVGDTVAAANRYISLDLIKRRQLTVKSIQKSKVYSYIGAFVLTNASGGGALFDTRCVVRAIHELAPVTNSLVHCLNYHLPLTRLSSHFAHVAII
jgi:hypothetical protein